MHPRLSGDNAPVVHADKKDLRDEILQGRRGLSGAAISAARAAVCAAVLARCDAAGWRVVAAYVPLRTEPGSPELLAGLLARGVRVLVPVTLADRDLDWVELRDAPRDTEHRDVPLGVEAIATADAVLVPALAVARDGTRLGRGGGSYDRALARVRPGTKIAALVYDDELRAHVPSQAWDRPVTAWVTPSGGWHGLG